MLGSHPLSAVLGADVSATSPTQTLRAYVKGLTDNGLHLLLCEPYTKFPADYRTPAQKSADAEAERREKEEDGVTSQAAPSADTAKEQKARGGVHMATNDVARLRQYLTRARKADENLPINLAFEVGRSNILVVDCDTAEQREAFCDWFAQLIGDERLRYTIPTVLSPGEYRDGTWFHRDGGHYYFDASEVDLPHGSGKMSVNHNGHVFDMFWRNRYILIPPSIRKEGAYSRVGPVLTLKDYPQLVQLILNAGAEQEARLASRRDSYMSPEMKEAIKDWYPTMSWEEILLPVGYRSGRPDACGCPTFMRPGGSHEKSVTCHVPGCDNDKYNHDDPPAHFWTTNPEPSIREMIENSGGSGTLSKLQLLAALHFDGDTTAAMDSAGILPQHAVVSVGDGMFGMSAQVMGNGTVVNAMDGAAEPLARTESRGGVAVAPAPQQATVTSGMFGGSSSSSPQNNGEGKFNVTVPKENTFSGLDMFGGVSRAVPAPVKGNPFAGVRDTSNQSYGYGVGYSGVPDTPKSGHNEGYVGAFTKPEHQDAQENVDSPAYSSHKATYPAAEMPSNSPSQHPADVTSSVPSTVTGTVTSSVTRNESSRYSPGYENRYGNVFSHPNAATEQGERAGGEGMTYAPPLVPKAPVDPVIAPAPVTDSDTEKTLVVLEAMTGMTREQIISEALREYRANHISWK